MTLKQRNAVTNMVVAILIYLLDYLILNPESFLNWNSFRTAVLGALVVYFSKNRKKIIAVAKGFLS